MKISNSQKNKSLVTVASCLILAVALLRLLWLTSQSLPNLQKSATATFNNLPFSIEKQLRQRYGAFYELVHRATKDLPKSIIPKVRSGWRLRSQMADQIMQRLPHHGTNHTDELYIIHGVQEKHLNKPMPILHQPNGTRKINASNGESVKFRFTTLGQTPDTLDEIYIAVNAESNTICKVSCSDDGQEPPEFMASATATISSKGMTRLQFIPPLPLLNHHGGTPYLLEFEFTNPVTLMLASAQEHDKVVEVGENVYRDSEPACAIIVRMVDTRGYTLIEAPFPTCYIFVKTQLLTRFGLKAPFSQKDYKTIAQALTSSKMEKKTP